MIQKLDFHHILIKFVMLILHTTNIRVPKHSISSNILILNHPIPLHFRHTAANPNPGQNPAIQSRDRPLIGPFNPFFISSPAAGNISSKCVSAQKATNLLYTRCEEIAAFHRHHHHHHRIVLSSSPLISEPHHRNDAFWGSSFVFADWLALTAKPGRHLSPLRSRPSTAGFRHSGRICCTQDEAQRDPDRLLTAGRRGRCGIKIDISTLFPASRHGGFDFWRIWLKFLIRSCLL